MSPVGSFGQAIAGYATAAVAEKRRITLERVEAVVGDGRTVQVRGRLIPVTGRVPIAAGETVPVAWENGQPKVVLMAQARRTGGAELPGVPGAPIVEELFVVDNPDVPGDNEVWFRNASVFAKICAGIPNEALSELGLHWGPGSADYFCVEGLQTGGPALVFKLNRPTANEPFPTGVIPKATLVRTWDFGAAGSGTGPVLGSISEVLTGSGAASFSGDLKWRSVVGHVISTLFFGGLAPDGTLLVVVNVTFAIPMAAIFKNGFCGSLLVNGDTGEILANHLVSGFTGPLYDSVFSPDGTFTITLTPSTRPAASCGLITPMSLKTDPQTQRPAVNNYMVDEPANVEPTVPAGEPDTRVFSIEVFGEFAQKVRTTPRPGSPRFAASRTKVVWADQFASSFGPLTVTNLRTRKAHVAGSAADVFGNAFPSAFSFIHWRALIPTQADLLYHARDTDVPYNRRVFFPAGARAGAVQVGALKPDPQLAACGPLKAAPLNSREERVLFFASASALQVIDSKAILSALGLFQEGPL